MAKSAKPKRTIGTKPAVWEIRTTNPKWHYFGTYKTAEFEKGKRKKKWQYPPEVDEAINSLRETLGEPCPEDMQVIVHKTFGVVHQHLPPGPETIDHSGLKGGALRPLSGFATSTALLICRALRMASRLNRSLKSEELTKVVSALEEAVLDLCGVPEDNSDVSTWDDPERFARDAFREELGKMTSLSFGAQDFDRFFIKIRKMLDGDRQPSSH